MTAELRECEHCHHQAAEGHEGSGEHRGRWFCSGCWAEWQRALAPLDASQCDSVELLRSEVARLRRELSAAETLRVSSPCTDVVHWSELDSTAWQNRWRYWESWCPCCKRPLCVSSYTPLEGAPSGTPPAAAEHAPPRLAYVSGLWGASAGYALGALVLGCSLRRRGTPPEIDLVLLHTDDVPQSTLALLAEVWILKPVDYVAAHPDLFACKGTRFDAVFTKLHVFGLVEYDKVVMLDLDLAIMRCPDVLFELPAPAALHRTLYGNDHGARIDGRNFFAPGRIDDPDSQVYEWGQCGGINAGVMVLAPSARRHRQVLHEVSTMIHPERIPGNGPEQDYLSRLFAPDWTHIGVAYNYQLHRAYHSIEEAARRASERCLLDQAAQGYEPERLAIRLEDICVVHFSGTLKMWDRDYRDPVGESDEAFTERLLKGDSPWYYRLWFERGGEPHEYEAVGWRPASPHSWQLVNRAHAAEPPDGRAAASDAAAERATDQEEEAGCGTPCRASPLDAWLDHLRSTAQAATAAWHRDLQELPRQFPRLPPLQELLRQLREPGWPAGAAFAHLQRVDYYWYRSGEWFPAVVVAAHSDGTFSVEFETPGAWGTGAQHVRPHMLREPPAEPA